MSKHISEEIRAAVTEAVNSIGIGNQKLGWSVDEFAEVSGLGRTRLFQAIKDRQLRARKFGKRTVILVEDGRSFLAALPDRVAA